MSDAPSVPARNLEVEELDLGAGQPVGADRLPLAMKPHAQDSLRLAPRIRGQRPSAFRKVRS